ncbi:enoyl-CoA hydratase/isomerase family protein [Phytohabitans suffuscus]|uniref:enoyl-CoA hydratase/isomerase family protein n=1 Tax=Phytohabitans suffuscus TaxID=624315 RepID=UPI001564DB08|nr:enoyl-CoA hydratase/isomerase family protein [Phytohabitans suffuscus]
MLLLDRRDNGVCIVTLNRPRTLNAFNAELHHALPILLAELDDDVDVRAVVLTGAGNAFSSGGDRSSMGGDIDLTEKRRSFRAGRRLIENLLALHVPLIAAVNGPAVGLGATIATAADLVLMSDSAFLADTHVTVGLVAGDGGALTWPALVGLLRAKEYLLTGDRLTAQKALEFGLANRVCPADQLMTEALAMAGRIARLAPQAVQDTKQLLNQQLRVAAVAVLGQGLAAETVSQFTPEYRASRERFAARGRG